MKKSLSKSSKKPVKRLKLDSSFLKIGPAAKTLGVSIDTLRRWEKSGKITAERTPGGTRLYSLSALKQVNPSVETYQIGSLSTEELLKKVEKDTILGYKDTTRTEGSPSIPVSQYPSIPTKSSLLTKFLIGSAFLSVVILAFASWITISHFTSKNEPPPPVLVTQQPNNNSAVLAATSTSPFLEINSDTQINGLLSVRDSINGLILEATPSAGTIALNAGTTTLTVTKDALLDQDVSTTATPGFNTLNLSATKDQLVFQSGAAGGTLTWTPTAARTITLPDATDTLVGKATTDTLTNKSISGSSNTLTNIPNSALTNNKVTVTAGTNLTGGGDITLGSSVTIALKDSPSITSLTTTGIVSLADGTAAAPALTFTSDTNTGLYRIGADKIGLITGGSATSGMTIDSSGNVGIGTISPTSALHVSGTGNITGNVSLGGTLGVTGAATFSSTGSFASTLTASNGLTLTTGALSLTSTSGSAALTLSSSATAFNVQSGLFDIDTQSSRVGIGTASPGSTLNVIGNVGIGTSSAGASLAVNGNGVIGWGTASVAGPSNGLGVSGNVGIGTTTANSNLSVAGNTHIGSLYQGTAAPTDGLFVDGNVGIGTTTSSNKLDVWGNSRLAGTLAVDSTSSFGGNLTLNSGQFLTPNGTASLPSYAFTNSTSTGMYSPSSNALALNTNGASTPPLTITAAGSVGIGVTAPTQLFQVNPTGPNSIVITSAGNVGIGTTSPAANLHVTGTSKFDGISTHGNILPDADITYDLGSAAVRWNNAYVYTLTATNIAGVVTGGSTTSSDWMINANNTLDSANSTVTFKRGSPTNAVLQWYGNNNTFDFNSGIRIGVNNGSASTIESTTGLVLSGFANDITTGTNEHLSLIPNGTGNVGIGTSSPGALLGVLGGVNIGGGTSRFAEKAGPANGLAVEGNVGIGTTSPLAPLHVWGNNTNSALFLNGNVGIGTISPTSGLNVYGTSEAASQLTLQRFDGAARSITITPSSSSLYASVTTSSTLGLLFNTAGYQELYLNGLGNVGIGTTNPSYQLQTTGNVGIGGSLTVTSAATFSSTGSFASTLTASNGLTLTTGALSLTSTSGQANLALSSNANAFTVNGLFGIDTTNNRVGIGTTAPQVALQVLGGNVGIGTSAAGAALQVNGGGLFGWGTASVAGPTNGLAVSGNVGIGTTSFTSGLSGLQIQPAARTKTALLVTDSDGSSSFEINLGSGGQSTIYQRDSEGVIKNTFGTGGDSYITGGNVGIGAASPGALLHVTGNAMIGYASGGTPASLANGLAVSGNVGIGTTSPAYQLETTGNVGIGGSLTVSSGLSLPNSSILNSYLVNSSISVSATAGTGLSVSGSPVSLGGTLTLAGIDASTTVKGVASFNSTNFSVSSGAVNTIQDIATSATPTFVGLNTTSGNVGIGTSATGVRLAVNGAGLFGWGTASVAGPSNGLAVSGNVGIGTTSPLAPLQVQGNGTNSAFFLNGNVGIGTVSPTSGLNIYGTSQAASQLTIQRFDGAARSLTLTPASGSLYASMTTSSTQGLLFNTTGYQELYLNGLGNVGIGTTNPSYQLQTTGNVGIGGSLTVTSAGVFSSGIKVSGSADLAAISGTSLTTTGNISSQGVFLAANGTASLPSYSFSNLTNAGLWTNGDGLLLTAGGTNTKGITVTGAGNIGIGNTAPGSLFTSTPMLRVTGFTGTTGGSAAEVGWDGTNAVFSAYDRGGNAYKPWYAQGASYNFDISGTVKAVIDSSGNVGIGFTSPSVALQVASVPSAASSLANILGANGSQLSLTGSTATTLQSKLALGIDTSNNFGYIQAGNIAGTATAYNLALEPNGGNVGIGTTNPGQKLEVNSWIRISDGTTINDIYSLNSNAYMGTSSGHTLNLTTSNVNRLSIDSSGLATTVSSNTPWPVFQNTNLTNLLPNADMESWTAGTSTAPDGWTHTSAYGTVAREGTTIKTGVYSAKVGRGAAVADAMRVRHTLTWDNYYQGKTVTFGAWVWTDTASNARLSLYDGVGGYTYSSYHTGGSSWEYLTVSKTLDAAASMLLLDFYVNVASQFGYFDGATLTEGPVAYAFAPKPLNDTDSQSVYGATNFLGNNVGIGMSAPDRLLHIAGTIDITSSNAGLMGVSGTQFDISGATTNAAKKLVLGIDTTDNYGVIQAGNTDGTNYALSLNPAGGNVGIGTTTPLAALDIRNAMSIGTAGSNEGTITFRTTGAGETAPSVAASAGNLVLTTATGWVNLAGDNGIQVTGNGNNIWWTANSGNATFDFYGGSATTLSIKNTNQGTVNLSLPKGNIGIGTSATGAALQVNGGGLFGWGTASVAGPSNGLAVSGNVGIGTTSPLAPLHVWGNNTNSALFLNGNVGIGVTAPAQQLQVAGKIRIASSSYPTQDLYLNDGELYIENSGYSHQWVKIRPGGSTSGNTTSTLALQNADTAGNYNSVIQFSGQATSYIAAGFNVGIGTSSPGARLGVLGGVNIGGDSSRFAEKAGPANGLAVEGNVGIGTTSPARSLHTTGSIRMGPLITGGGTAVAMYRDANGDLADSTSSILYKTDINPYESVLSKVMQLNAVRFKWNDLTPTPGSADFGMIAEEVNQVIPDLVIYNSDGVTPHGLKYEKMGLIALKAIQEQQTEIASQSAQLSSLSSTITSQSAQLISQGLSLSTQGETLSRLSGTLSVSGGNVGIGTSNPTSALDVVGNVNVSGSVNTPLLDLGPANIASISGNIAMGFTNDLNGVIPTTFNIQNQTGSNIFSVDSSGNMKLAGTITSSAGAFDVAEIYKTVGGAEEGDVVSLSSDSIATPSASLQNDNSAVEKSSKPYDSKLIGIISTKPGLTLSSDTLDGKPVALNGRVPVKVSTENGPVFAGDFLTSSATSGVAMKATKPGQVVGKALENYDNPDPHQVGKIMIFVNVTFADPGNFLASLSLDEEGNMIIPKIRTSSLLIGPISPISQITTDGTQITTNSDPNYTSPGPNLASNTNSYIDLSGEIASLKDRIAHLESVIANNNTSGVSPVPSDALSPEVNTEATPSAVIAEATSSAEETPDVSSSTSGVDKLDLTPPEILYNTGSAVFTNLTVKSEATMSGQLAAYDLSVSNTLKSLGKTTLADTLIAGDLTIDGTLSISRNSINAIGLNSSGVSPGSPDVHGNEVDSGILYLQKSLLAQGLDIFNGKVTIDPAGNITTQGKIIASEVKTNKLTISNTPIATSSATLAASIGTATLPANATSVTIQTSQAYDSAKVFITPITNTDKTLSVTNIKNNESFDVSVLTPSTADINFNWWIVQTE